MSVLLYSWEFKDNFLKLFSGDFETKYRRSTNYSAIDPQSINVYNQYIVFRNAESYYAYDKNTGLYVLHSETTLDKYPYIMYDTTLLVFCESSTTLMNYIINEIFDNCKNIRVKSCNEDPQILLIRYLKSKNIEYDPRLIRYPFRPYLGNSIKKIYRISKKFPGDILFGFHV